METNNKLREALTKILNLTNSLDEDCAVDPVEIRDIARAALAEPVRNYEVGTVEEQADRLDLFCSKYKCSGAWDSTSPECPILEDQRGVMCAIAWAHMPYEESKAKGG